MTVQKYQIRIRERTIPLLFDLEPDKFVSDANLGWILERGLPEPEVLNAMVQIIKPGDTVIDAGANIGFFSVIMSKLVGSTGHVIAVEPDRRNLAKLRKNLDINNCHNALITGSPLTAKPGERKFYLHGENGTSTLYDGLQNNGGLVEVQTLKTTTLTEIIGKQRPKLIKLDVEGAELEAMRGCGVKIPFVICEANEEALSRAGASVHDLRFHMENVVGYNTFLLSENGSMPAMLSSAFVQKLVTTRPNTNIMFARFEEVIRAWPEVKA